MSSTALLCAVVSLVAQPGGDPRDPLPPGSAPRAAWALEDAFPGQEDFTLPLWVGFRPGDPGHAYVVEQDGRIWRIPRDGERDERQLLLDFEDRVLRANWEEGLLGLAFDPAHEENGLLYVYWSERLPGAGRRSVVSRLRVVEDGGAPRADPASELRILEVPQPYGNHNGGTIVFGPAGMLYVALGDGGSANDPHGNGQDLGTLLGSVLRIDVRGASAEEPYRVPDDNPFVDRPDARGEIWCYGMRNPWRIAFDRETGALWCGDVGQNLWEEVDVLVPGGNYGWNFMEATHEFDARRGDAEPPGDLVPPVAEYGRDQGISVTGGHVYRGEALPELDGAFVYGDFATRRVWAVREGEEPRLLLDHAPARLSSFAEEPEGELLLIAFDGRIRRLVRG